MRDHLRSSLGVPTFVWTLILSRPGRRPPPPGALGLFSGTPFPHARKKVMGLPGYWVILFDPAAVHDPAGFPLARPTASRTAAFRANDPLSTGVDCNFGAISAAESLAWLRINHPIAGMTASLATGLLARR